MGDSLFPQDNSDIVLLACRAQAKVGGNSACASSHAVHNEILATRPDLHKVTWAAKPFRLSRSLLPRCYSLADCVASLQRADSADLRVSLVTETVLLAFFHPSESV
jgi:hypothetical protein